LSPRSAIPAPPPHTHPHLHLPAGPSFLACSAQSRTQRWSRSSVHRPRVLARSEGDLSWAPSESLEAHHEALPVRSPLNDTPAWLQKWYQQQLLQVAVKKAALEARHGHHGCRSGTSSSCSSWISSWRPGLPRSGLPWPSTTGLPRAGLPRPSTACLPRAELPRSAGMPSAEPIMPSTSKSGEAGFGPSRRAGLELILSLTSLPTAPSSAVCFFLLRPRCL
jgi:hypothetical protein